MSFASDLSNEPVIDDSNADEFAEYVVDGEPLGKGWEPRDFEADPYGEGFAAPFPLQPIPRAEWRDRIQEGERTKSFLSHVCDRAGVKVKNQAQTNYCWINAPVHCMEILRAVQGQKHVELSPASVGAPMTKYANANGSPAGVGGWGTKGLKYLAEVGACPVELWPANAINKKYDTNVSRAERAKYRVTEWWDMKPGSFDQLMTCLLLRIPVAIGLSWWRHEVTAIDPVVDKNGQFGVRINNSYGTSWGTNGRGILMQSKATPSDAVAPRVVVAS